MPPGTLVTGYPGERVTNSQEENWQSQVGNSDKEFDRDVLKTMEYVIRSDEGDIIDGLEQHPHKWWTCEGLGHFANDAIHPQLYERPKENNCVFRFITISTGNSGYPSIRRPYLVATRWIEPNDEILVSYGKSYWITRLEMFPESLPKYLVNFLKTNKDELPP
jgi:hypothetical protein